MIKCSKCNGVPSENDVIGWKCNSCEKTFKTTKTQLHNILMKKKENPEQTFLKCPSCKISLDDGNESITWKCACGTINMGKLKDFEEEVENYPKSNLVKCPECGREFDDSLIQCPNCGYSIKENEKPQLTLKQKEIEYLKSLQVFLRVLIITFIIIATVFFYKAYDVKNNYRNTDYAIINENAYVGGDAYNYIINGTYFTGYSIIGSVGMLCATVFSVSTIWISIKIRERINDGD